MMPWDADEIAWARECFLAGDDIEEIAAASGRTVQDVAAQLHGMRLTPREREIVSLYTSGCSYVEIARERGGSWRAAAATVTNLRRKGLAIPHRNAGWARAQIQGAPA